MHSRTVLHTPDAFKATAHPWPAHVLPWYPQDEERRRAAEAAAAVAAEEARVLALQEEYEASLPEDIKGKVLAVLEREVVSSS